MAFAKIKTTQIVANTISSADIAPGAITVVKLESSIQNNVVDADYGLITGSLDTTSEDYGAIA